MAENNPPGYPDVRLHQLEGFYYVALARGFTRGAQRMPHPITQPALHQQVRKLERRLGRTLLVRGPERAMVLTPEGRALFDFVAPYFEQLPGVLRTVSHGTSGALVVATDPFFVEELCAPAFARLRKRFPAARLRLVECLLADMTTGLIRGELDLSVSTMGTTPDGLVFEPLGSLRLHLLVPADHELGDWAELRNLEVLARHRFVLYEPGSEGRSITDALLKTVGLTLEVAGEVSSAASIAAFVRAGLAPGFVPSLHPLLRGRQRLPEGVTAFDLTALLQPTGELPRFGLLRRHGLLPAGLVAAFCEEARQLAAGWQGG